MESMFSISNLKNGRLVEKTNKIKNRSEFYRISLNKLGQSIQVDTVDMCFRYWKKLRDELGAHHWDTNNTNLGFSFHFKTKELCRKI